MAVKLDAELIESFVSRVLAPAFDNPKPTPQFHREIWEMCTSEFPLVAIGAPRGHAKSTAVSLAYLMAAMLFRDRTFALIVSDTEGQAKEFLGDIKKELQTNEHLIHLFGVDKFVRDTETDIIVQMDDGYQFRIVAKGSEQKVRGTKWNHMRPDLIIGDDLENDEIVMNKDRREKFRNWVTKALLPTRSPNGIVRIVGTILHLDSFLSRITPEEGGKMTERQHLKLVSITPKRRVIWHSVVYQAHVGNTPADIESPKDILWPDQFSKEFFERTYDEKVHIGSPEAYAQEYLNRPLDDSYSLFRRSDFIAQTDDDKLSILEGRKPLNYYCGVDLAISDKERADWSVFQIVGIDAMNIMYHVNTIRERLDGKQIVDTLMDIQRRYQPEWIAIEQDKIGKSIGPFLREEMLRTGEFVTLVPIVPSQDKQTRIRSIQARLRMGTIRFDKTADYYPQLEKEFLEFPRSRHDDQVDAFSCIGLALEKMIHAQTLQEKINDMYEQERENADLPQGRSMVTGY